LAGLNKSPQHKKTKGTATTTLAGLTKKPGTQTNRDLGQDSNIGTT
jgi:hypothetical protein